MKNKPAILIAGAGVAGGSLAIRLASNGFAVTLVEREKFPRHKLCGEFVSPEALAHFRELGVLDEMLGIGGDRIVETVFYSQTGRPVAVPSKWFENGGGGALSISRAAMDLRMLERARSLGVEVLDETSVTGLIQNGRKMSAIKCRDKNGDTRQLKADLYIDATGRANVLARQLDKQRAKTPKVKIVAFKTHFRDAKIAAGVCEIYSFRGGYGGLSRIENGAANFCFIIDAAVVRSLGNDPDRVFREAALKNKRAAEAMSGAEPLFDWIAVSVDSFGKKNLSPAPNLITVGDAAAFIDPFTGSGMLMALESSALLSSCLAATPGDLAAAARNYERRYDEKFQRRLKFCEWVRRASFVPHIAGMLIFVLGLNKTLRHFLIRKTRSATSSRV